MASSSVRSGQFRNRKSDEHHIGFKDFENPFNFYALMFLPIQELIPLDDGSQSVGEVITLPKVW